MELLGAVLFWFIFSVVVGVAASGRGRTGLGWFLLALLLSPLLMLILVLVLPRIESQGKSEDKSSGQTNEEPQRKLYVSDTKPCPFCAEDIKTAAKVCRFCNRDLPEIEEETAPEKEIRTPVGMISVEEYCSVHQQNPTAIIKRIKDGKLEGRIISGVWFTKDSVPD